MKVLQIHIRIEYTLFCTFFAIGCIIIIIIIIKFGKKGDILRNVTGCIFMPRRGSSTPSTMTRGKNWDEGSSASSTMSRFNFGSNFQKRANFYHVMMINEHCLCLNRMFQDKETDRCYAAKHIRIRKPEQKEKVELSRQT